MYMLGRSLFQRQVWVCLGFSQVSIARLHRTQLLCVTILLHSIPMVLCWEGQRAVWHLFCVLVGSVWVFRLELGLRLAFWVGAHRRLHGFSWCVVTPSAARMGSHLTMGVYPLLLEFKTVFENL